MKKDIYNAVLSIQVFDLNQTEEEKNKKETRTERCVTAIHKPDSPTKQQERVLEFFIMILSIYWLWFHFFSFAIKQLDCNLIFVI